MPKKKEQEERPSWELGNIGTTMFTSLMIILLAFFIMLSSQSVIDEKRQREALGSLIGSFGIIPGGLSALGGEDKNLSPPTTPLDQIKSDIANMQDVIAHASLDDHANVLKTAASRVLRLQSVLLFPDDGVAIPPEMEPTVLELAGIMRGHDYKITIEAHTDDTPPKNPALINNWYVSGLRAANLMRLLAEKGGITPGRMAAFGFAGTRPVAVNNSPQNRARNRRVDLVLAPFDPSAIYKYEDENWKPSNVIFQGFSFKPLEGLLELLK